MTELVSNCNELAATSITPQTADARLHQGQVAVLLRWSSDILLSVECFLAFVWILVYLLCRRASHRNNNRQRRAKTIGAGFMAFFLSTALCALFGALGHRRGWFHLVAWSHWALLVYVLMNFEACTAVFIGGVLVCHQSRARWWALGAIVFLLLAVAPQLLLCPSDILAAMSVLLGKVWLLTAAIVSAVAGPPMARNGQNPEIEMMPVTNKDRAAALVTEPAHSAKRWTRGCLAVAGACALMLAGGVCMGGTELWLRMDKASKKCRHNAFYDYLAESPLSASFDSSHSLLVEQEQTGVDGQVDDTIFVNGKDEYRNYGNHMQGVQVASSIGNVSLPISGSPFFALKTIQIALANGLMHRLAMDAREEQEVPKVDGAHYERVVREGGEEGGQDFVGRFLKSAHSNWNLNTSRGIGNGEDVSTVEADRDTTNLARLHYFLNHWDLNDRAVYCIARAQSVRGQQSCRPTMLLQVLQQRLAIMHIFYALAMPLFLIAFHLAVDFEM